MSNMDIKKYSVFMDESGNSGSNFLDLQQPIFSLIGLGINDDRMVDIINEIDKIRKKYKVMKGHRLHAKRMNVDRREKMTREIIEMLMTKEFSLFFSIIEKKYLISTYIDSDLYDPYYNDNCDNTWTYPGIKHNERANFFYNNIKEDTIVACGKAFQTGEDLKIAFELIKRDIHGKKYEIDLYDILCGAERHLEDLADTISYLNSGNDEMAPKSGVAQSPNLISFCGLLSKIEYFHSMIEGSKVKLVFDHSRQFNLSFSNFFDKLKNAKKISIKSEDKYPSVMGYDHIESFNFEKSENSIFLQLADLIATAIMKVTQKVLNDKKNQNYSEFELYILFIIFSHWFEFKNLFCDILIPNSGFLKVFKILDKESSRFSFNN